MILSVNGLNNIVKLPIACSADGVTKLAPTEFRPLYDNSEFCGDVLVVKVIIFRCVVVKTVRNGRRI